MMSSLKKFGVAALGAVAMCATSANVILAQAVVEDPMAIDAGVTAYGTKLGTTGAAILLLGFGFLLAWKGWTMIRRFVK